ncbi:MAG: TatD family nuclease-associated radical SAM protein [Candidatus Gastranaerophilales bacterium]|nr:TatD family nuclease-associated radical SAM protein [Candidatus Gastranaerophilales bacterium]
MNGTAENLNLVYTLEGKIYINLTNKCTNRCVFCIRNSSDIIEGKNLWLSNEKFSADDVISQFEHVLSENKTAKEVVFCGFGEPLIKFDMFCEVSAYIKKNYPDIKIRVNTNGQANLIHKKDIIPELSKHADAVSISLNGENKEVYNTVSQPADKENSYKAVKDFIKECVEKKINTTATVVSGCDKAPVNTEECKKIADSLGAAFRVREWLPKGY